MDGKHEMILKRLGLDVSIDQQTNQLRIQRVKPTCVSAELGMPNLSEGSRSDGLSRARKSVVDTVFLAVEQGQNAEYLVSDGLETSDSSVHKYKNLSTQVMVAIWDDNPTSRSPDLTKIRQQPLVQKVHFTGLVKRCAAGRFVPSSFLDGRHVQFGRQSRREKWCSEERVYLAREPELYRRE